jgi:Transposase DDE domain
MIPFLRKLFADAAYAGPIFLDGTANVMPALAVEIVKRRDNAQGFIVEPQRWIVERTIGWLNRCRRLANDWRTATTTRSPTCTSPPSVSCSESSAIPHEVSERTVRVVPPPPLFASRGEPRPIYAPRPSPAFPIRYSATIRETVALLML